MNRNALPPRLQGRYGWSVEFANCQDQTRWSGLPGVDRGARERFRGHPHFEFTARFVAEFDQTTIRADLPTLPLEAFVPMVHRFFATPPRAVELP